MKRPTRFLLDSRNLLCAGAILFWWLMLPNEPGDYFTDWRYFFTTAWGQMAALFMAAVLLWIDHYATRLVSLCISFLMFYGACHDINNFYTTATSLLEWGKQEGWHFVALHFIWRNLLVCTMATFIAVYTVRDIIRKIMLYRASSL
jgi:hypothetical protein